MSSLGTKMRRHHFFLGITLLELVVLGGLLYRGARTVDSWRRTERPAAVSLVKRLSLTDFAIWTEARYTRHPSQSDLFTPFQAFPSSLEHFPAGSVMSPPAWTGQGRPRGKKE
jgi:hypothetical protein